MPIVLRSPYFSPFRKLFPLVPFTKLATIASTRHIYLGSITSTLALQKLAIGKQSGILVIINVRGGFTNYKMTNINLSHFFSPSYSNRKIYWPAIKAFKCADNWESFFPREEIEINQMRNVNLSSVLRIVLTIFKCFSIFYFLLCFHTDNIFHKSTTLLL